MKSRILFASAMLVAVVILTLLTLMFTKRAPAISEATVIPPDWKNGETHAFAIHRPAVGRQATAYFRILTGEYEGRPIFKIVYNAKSDTFSEASETIVDAVTLEPYKTARKNKSASGVSYTDISYGERKIVVRRKTGEQGTIRETIIDFPGRIFDYYEVMWLIPQLDFSNDDRLHFALFTPVGDQTLLVVVRNMGEDSFEFHGKKFKGTRFMYNLNLVTQEVWVGTINGRKTVLKYDTGEHVFYNLALLKGEAVKELPPKTEAKKEEPAKEEEKKEPAPPEEEGKVYF